MDPLNPGISVRAYAKHRGVTQMAVHKAIKNHRLVASVVRGDTGRVSGVTSVAEADAEWEKNTNYEKAPRRAPGGDLHRMPGAAAVGPVWAPDASTPGDEPPAGESIASASERQKYWQARLAELKFLEAAKQLVLAAEVDRKLDDVFRTCRTKLLGVPTRAKQQLPHLSVGDVQVLEQVVREALTELAGSEVKT